MHSPAPARANRLAREKSPYLLQHATNPVDWYPWGDEAFARARAEDKPIFLSIGYSTCHWCHVMERESFTDEAVAAALNADFVPVKVDREERPDVDRIYMTAMQALGQGGGWPLNVVLTPALEPFWGGTYFPRSTTMGRPGMLELLPAIARAWREQRARIESTGAQVLALLGTLSAAGGEAQEAAALADTCARFLEGQHDEQFGGFGGAPKFPSPANLHFLVRRWARRGGSRPETGSADRTLPLVLAQLEAMRANGLHDHLGGGFHRYATDRQWRIPHFEKMLYDQALLAEAYLEAFRATADPRWSDTAAGVFEYVARDLTSAEGAFFSAEDADSEGEEGRFYAWTPAELEAVLGAGDAAVFARHYGVTETGNFEHGTTVLHETEPAADAATCAALARMRALLLAARDTRVRPHRDDKVITAWNGLMIAALALGARSLDRPDLATRAARAADFVWTHLRAPDGSLLRRWREGEAALPGQLDDHAYFARACLELYLATFEPLWLERAAHVADVLIRRFGDDDAGGFFESPEHADGVRVRLKDRFDGAELAGNSVAGETLWRLGTLLERPEWRERAQQTFAFFCRRLADGPRAMPWMVAAMERAAQPPRSVVIAGEPADAGTRALVAAFESRFLPDDDLLLVSGASRAALAVLAPFAAGLPMRDGRPTAYVCRDFACENPVHDPSQLLELLQPNV